MRPLPQTSAESQEVCCDSSAIDLYLIGADGSGEMTPFEAELAEESEEKKSLMQSLSHRGASWEINPSWPGEYPSSTWQFSIEYEVENAGGVQINASVEVSIGGETYIGTTDQSNSFLPSGQGTLSIDIDVDSVSVSSGLK